VNQILKHENPEDAPEEISMVDRQASVTSSSGGDLPGLSLPQIIHWEGRQNDSEEEGPGNGFGAAVAPNGGTRFGALDLCSPSW